MLLLIIRPNIYTTKSHKTWLTQWMSNPRRVSSDALFFIRLIISSQASWNLDRPPNHPLSLPPVYLLQSTPFIFSSMRKKNGPLNPSCPHSLYFAITFFHASAYSRSRVLSETWCLAAISVLVSPTLPEHHFSTRMSYCKSDNPHTCFIARNLSRHLPFA